MSGKIGRDEVDDDDRYSSEGTSLSLLTGLLDLM